MPRFLRENSLSLFFLVLLVAALLGQAIAGHSSYNAEQREHREDTVSFGRYVASSAYARAVTENWQSEYLQFALFFVATVWLIQRGSPESKQPGEEGLESEEHEKIGRHATSRSPLWARAGGVRTAIYSNSLLITMGLLFFASWFVHSLTGWNEFNDDQQTHGQSTLSWGQYLGSANFWEQTFQNWQSEFLAVGSMAIFAVYLRQRGSPESKPTGAPHHETGH